MILFFSVLDNEDGLLRKKKKNKNKVAPEKTAVCIFLSL